MANFDKEDNLISYSSEATRLKIPSFSRNEETAFRLHVILNRLGPEVFLPFYEALNGNYKELNKINLKSFSLCELDIYYCYFSCISHSLEKEDELLQSELLAKAIFPLENVLTKKALKFDKKKVKSPLRNLLKSCEDIFPDYIRAKLAVFELMYAITQEEDYVKPLLYFSKSYFEDLRIKHLIFEEDFLNKAKLMPWESAKTEFGKDKLIYLIYELMYGEVRECHETKDYKAFKEKHQTKDENLFHGSPREITLNVLKDKKIVTYSDTSGLEKFLKRNDEIYGVERKVGNKKKGLINSFEDSQALGPAENSFREISLFCFDDEKYKIIRGTNYSKCFDINTANQFLENENYSKYYDMILKLLNF